MGKREINWKEKLGDDLNWALSFDNLKEAETTKHVHRLHPYKGKFIPQLVEYFLDEHTDDFKTETYFQKDDIVLDPFCGSGTNLVQSSELGINAIGVDISAFNAFIGNVKVGKYDFDLLEEELKKITKALEDFLKNEKTLEFEQKLTEKLAEFNTKYFPSPDYKRKLRLKEIDGDKFGAEKEKAFLPIFEELIEEYEIKLKQEKSETFLDQWYLDQVRKEIDFVFDLVKEIEHQPTKKVVALILSRTIRSCRATTHADLATLKEPISTTYYCAKHGKICKPLFSILSWWKRYSKDTLKRLKEFEKLRSETQQICLAGDATKIDILEELKKRNPELAKKVETQKIKGIFSSPPYVGLIDYHEQHAYAYDLLGFERHDEQEIGRMAKGKGKLAREQYAEGIANVLKNSKRFLAEDYDIFLVANDKFGLYSKIAEDAGMQIVNQYKRPVLNRTEKDKNAYSEIIFHLKEKQENMKEKTTQINPKEVFATGVFLQAVEVEIDGQMQWRWIATRFEDETYLEGESIDLYTYANSFEGLLKSLAAEN